MDERGNYMILAGRETTVRSLTGSRLEELLDLCRGWMTPIETWEYLGRRRTSSNFLALEI